MGNRPAGAQKWPETSGELSGTRWAPVGRQGRSEADLGRLLDALGALLAVLELVLGLLGPLLGSLWALPGVILASRESLFRGFEAVFLMFGPGPFKITFFDGSICVFVCCFGSLFDPLVPFSRRPRRVCEH